MSDANRYHMILDSRLRRNLDWPLFALAYLIALVGIVMLFSLTRFDPSVNYRKQILWLAIGTAGMVGAMFLDYHVYARVAKQLYIANIGLLLIVMKFAPHVKGAARWIRVAGFQFQPSEFAKLVVILTLTAFLARRRETIGEWKTLLLSFAYVAVPMALIFKQPDLGTALIVLAIWAGMVFVAGAKLQHLAALAAIGLTLFAGLWYSGLLKEYQKERVRVLINPDSDSKATGYHVYQARIAIGSGGMWGKGLLHSTQVRGGYIPEKDTDFIFTSVGEQLGFVGSVALTALYAGLLLRGAQIIAAADEDYFGKLIATGVITMLAFHVVVNIGMNIGVMPVAGVPLPLVSAGGSNMILTLICIGLLQSVLIHRHQLLFR